MVNLLRVAGWSGTVRASARDLDAEFEALVERHYRHVYALLFRALRNEADAADLTQETFIRVYRALPRLRHHAASPAWIRRIALNLCVDFVRRRKRAMRSFALESDLPEGVGLEDFDRPCENGEDPADAASDSERKRTIHGAIDQLPRAYRTVVVMHHILGMRVADIAELLDVPTGTVKSRLSRARGVLHRTLAAFLTIE